MTPTMTHSEPAREAVAACPFCGGQARTFSMNGTTQATCAGKFTECAGFDVSAPVAMWNRRASPAPAAGGLEAADLNDAQDAVEHLNEGDFYADYDRAVRHVGVLRRLIAGLASPAATSAEQGVDGVREAPTVAKLFGNCDNWGAAEWFERLANAVMEQDKAIAAEDMLSFETYRNIAASSAMELVRGYRTEVRAALAPSTSAATRREPVAWIYASALPLQKDTRDTSHMAMVYASRSGGFGGQRVALYDRPAPVGSAQVKVKPLEWREFQYTPLRVGFEASTEIGVWRVFEFDEGWAWWRNADSRSAYLTSEVSVKAAAQSDYEARIRASLATDAEGDRPAHVEQAGPEIAVQRQPRRMTVAEPGKDIAVSARERGE